MFALVRSTRQPGEPRNLLPDTQIGAGRGSWRSHLDCRGAAKCGPDASSAHANVKLHDPPVYLEGDVVPALDTEQTCRSVNGMSASLIGHSGSSAFRLSTSAVSMSLAGSRFSSESAPRPFHHGIRRGGGTIFQAALPLADWQVQADMRTHLTHRPARDIIPPPGGARVSFYWIRCCTVFMLLLRPVVGSSGTRCRQPICGA